MNFEPIGYVCSGSRYRFEAPRQAVFAEKGAVIELSGGMNFEEALADLAGFDRIWVIFCFHLNLGNGFKPKVRPPVSPDGGRYGVFATRSPHRPNPIGLSAVELLGIDGRRLLIGANDLLDGTPVLDIKPYIPEVDAFPSARAGWREGLQTDAHTVTFLPEAQIRAEWIEQNSGLDLINFARIQLSHAPLDSSRKRLSVLPDGLHALGCRTWQLVFRLSAELRQVEIIDIHSNYTPDDLSMQAADPYQDKSIHRSFLAIFD